MKKLGFLLVILAFFGFTTMTSCNQQAKEAESTEEMAPAEDETAPAEDMEEPAEEEMEETPEE
jgi:hypothetical protein